MKNIQDNNSHIIAYNTFIKCNIVILWNKWYYLIEDRINYKYKWSESFDNRDYAYRLAQIKFMVKDDD